MQELRLYWSKLAAREKAMLIAGGAFLLLVLLYLLLWQPLLDARARLGKLLPRQQQTLQSARQLVLQIQSSGPVAAALELAPALAQASSVANLNPSQKQAIGSQRQQLTFESVAFAQWLKFAMAMQSAGWPALSLDVNAAGEPGKVKVIVEFGR